MSVERRWAPKPKKMIRSCILLFLLGLNLSISGQLEVDLESGRAFNVKNEVRYPNDQNSTAQRVNIPSEFGTGESTFLRWRTSYTFNSRHTISALFAPLTFENKGQFKDPTAFGGFVFNPQDQTTVTYRFNSYRLTYRYRLIDRESIRLDLGVTAKVRDARIAFETDGKSDETTDLGFVPLINFRLDYTPFDNLRFILEGDALAGPQGRAEDVFIGAMYNFSGAQALKLGYRILEGGADVDQVYNFALIHYASIGYLITIGA